ncbi:SagB/ThcOx family dehydrogenase [Actinoplanes sp. LDG1-06]|uniref:SagB/ThcOx family dehydrogenase n=1 Tax=Paractinoplanes ovalisporus TaxID=2810368 RepID=A0ABS2A4L3_9ACTN|nr:SagB/ThcOx family dehydrogenase [Actinoplanes ovalisporus]MBM2614789.1 SagB/ThcOx family dehydrogenase [Actinoplanes ovalisporus]
MKVRLNSAVSLLPPSDPGRRWTAENLLERHRYQVSDAAAAALVAAVRPQDSAELAERLARPGRPVTFWTRIVDSLLRTGLIVDPAAEEADPHAAWLTSVRAAWARYGWREAAEYHAVTFDYPCLDYTDLKAANAADQGRMRGYQSREADDDRCKLDHADRPGLPLPETSPELVTGTAAQVWGERPAGVPLTPDAFRTVLSLGFGVVGARVPRTDSAPLLLRTSPSGGGRNPSEGYVLVRDVPEVEPGWYHVTLRPFSLRRLPAEPPDEDALRRMFPHSVARYPFRARAITVLTSVFERNMYRYREPRTFRTVHMDAGHIAGTMSMAARSLGVAAGIGYCDRAAEIERVLGLDPMTEGYMLTVVLGDGTAVRHARD